jgi:large subunit ribosomal protein L15
VQRLPTKRGFTNIFRIAYSVVNVSRLGELFAAGAVVTPQILSDRRILRNLNRPVKILGDGDLEVPLQVFAHAFSRSALSKITEAGGTWTVLDPELMDAPPETEIGVENEGDSEEEQA